MTKKILTLAALALTALTATAQSGTNSPYSQWGLGVLSDQSQGCNRGMGGLSLGVRGGTYVNALNPASYSAVDSLTMLIDAGLSGQLSNFSENGVKLNAHNANIEYAVLAFRLMKNFGASAGILPLTNIGYDYSNSVDVGTSATTFAETYSGSGGLHQAYFGLGYKATPHLSVGANFSYLWGSLTKDITVVSSDAYVNSVNKEYAATVSSYKLDFGAQWEQPLAKTYTLTVGATVGLGHKLGCDPQVTTINKDTQTGNVFQTVKTAHNALSIPWTYAAGAALSHAGKWLVGADFSLQKWGSEDFPVVDTGSGDYVVRSGLLRDRHKLTVGGEITPNAMSRKFLNRVHYRAGASVADSYVRINGQDGPKEYSVSAGFGIPIANGWNTKSMLNISAQWVNTSAKGLITDNTFRINVGLTFNERWFMKWKVE